MYEIEGVTFSDDTFTFDSNRILEFCTAYAEQISLPFQCQTRPNHVTKEIFHALKNAGCQQVNIGLEAGNDWQKKQGAQTTYE